MPPKNDKTPEPYLNPSLDEGAVERPGSRQLKPREHRGWKVKEPLQVMHGRIIRRLEPGDLLPENTDEAHVAQYEANGTIEPNFVEVD